MKNLSITTVSAPKIHEALEISEERANFLIDKIGEAIDAVPEERDPKSEPIRITDLAKTAIDLAQPSNPNELFFLGIKFGEITEQNSQHGALEALLSAIMPSETDLASAIFRSTKED